jgi:hypothetical protein
MLRLDCFGYRLAMTRFTLLRHCEARSNPDNTFPGCFAIARHDEVPHSVRNDGGDMRGKEEVVWRLRRQTTDNPFSQRTGVIPNEVRNLAYRFTPDP